MFKGILVAYYYSSGVQKWSAIFMANCTIFVYFIASAIEMYAENVYG